MNVKPSSLVRLISPLPISSRRDDDDGNPRKTLVHLEARRFWSHMPGYDWWTSTRIARLSLGILVFDEFPAETASERFVEILFGRSNLNVRVRDSREHVPVIRGLKKRWIRGDTRKASCPGLGFTA